MAIVTERIVIMMFIMSMLIGIAMDSYDSITTDNIYGRLGNQSNYVTEKWDVNWKNVDTATATDEEKGFIDRLWTEGSNIVINTAKSVGNTLLWSYDLLRIFAKGLYPFSFTPAMVETQIEKLVVQVIVLFRSIVTILMMMQIWRFFRKGG